MNVRDLKVGDKVAIMPGNEYELATHALVTRVLATKLFVADEDGKERAFTMRGDLWGTSSDVWSRGPYLVETERAEEWNKIRSAEIRYKKAHRALYEVLDKNKRPGDLDVEKIEAALAIFAKESA